MGMENLNITFVAGREEVEHCNTYRMGYSEKDIILDFGDIELEGDSQEIAGIEIVTRVALPVEVLPHLLMSLFLLGRKYEAEYKRDIGMSLKDGKEE